MRQSVVVRQPMPPVAAVVSFIDAINRSDVGDLASLMSDDHRLHVFDESPLDGKDANIEGGGVTSRRFPIM
jgi:hypothetical protein